MAGPDGAKRPADAVARRDRQCDSGAPGGPCGSGHPAPPPGRRGGPQASVDLTDSRAGSREGKPLRRIATRSSRSQSEPAVVSCSPRCPSRRLHLGVAEQSGLKVGPVEDRPLEGAPRRSSKRTFVSLEPTKLAPLRSVPVQVGAREADVGQDSPVEDRDGQGGAVERDPVHLRRAGIEAHQSAVGVVLGRKRAARAVAKGLHLARLVCVLRPGRERTTEHQGARDPGQNNVPRSPDHRTSFPAKP